MMIEINMTYCCHNPIDIIYKKIRIIIGGQY